MIEKIPFEIDLLALRHSEPLVIANNQFSGTHLHSGGAGMARIDVVWKLSTARQVKQEMFSTHLNQCYCNLDDVTLDDINLLSVYGPGPFLLWGDMRPLDASDV